MNKILFFIFCALCTGYQSFGQNNLKRLSAVVSWQDSTNDGVDSVHYNWTNGGEESVLFKNYSIWDEITFRTNPPSPEEEDLTNYLHETNATTFKWQDTLSDYELYMETEVELDLNGRISKILKLFPDNQGTLQPQVRELFNYDSGRLVTYEFALSGNGGSAWTNKRKDIYTYVAGTNHLKQGIQQNGAAGNQWENAIKKEYEYAGNLMIAQTLSEWIEVSSSWDSFSIREFSYSPANLIDSMFFFHYSGGTSVKEPKYLYTYSYNQNNLLSHVFMSENEGGISNVHWKVEDSISFVHNGTLVTKSIWYSRDNELDPFEPSYRYDLSYDGSLLKKVKYAEWSATSQMWVSGTFGSNALFYYEDFEGTDIINLETALDFHLYPNPAREYITVEINNEEKIQTIQVVNIAGQIVFENKGSLSASKLTIPVHQLSFGVYYLNIRSTKGKGVQSFVVK